MEHDELKIWSAPRTAAASANAAHYHAGQVIGLRRFEGEDLVIQDGCAVVELTPLADKRRFLQLLYPGDLVTPELTFGAPQRELVALTTLTLQRRPVDADHPAASGEHRLAAILARSGLRSLTLALLSGEERLVTLLYEFTLFLGRKAPGGQVFDLPLSRTDIGDYVGLNPDTLSRLMTRLKERRLIFMPSRHRVIVPDVRHLAAATPLAEALQAALDASRAT